MPDAWWIEPDSGWLRGVRRCPSPNRDERPDPDDISLLVVHGISLPAGRFGGDAIERLFVNRLCADEHPGFAVIADLRVSAHVLIYRDGRAVQFVPFHQRAWHAGESAWQGRNCCNDFAIGVELEGTDHTPYTPAQYRVLAELAACLMRAYPAISQDRLVGHSDIAPGRKTDPGPAFDWRRFRRLLADPGRK